MKKTLLFLLMTLTGLSMMAKPVEPKVAVQVAKNFVAQYVKGANQYSAEVVYTHLMPKSKQAAMYVVNVGNTFVLVSANDVAHPVLGYSLSRPWPTKSGERTDTGVKLPSQITSYLDDLAGQIETASGVDPDQETAAEWQQLLTLNSQLLTTNPPDSVGPLLTTTWDQSPYYNALCPEDVNGQAVTGCVATAMAQIINYWGYPIHGRGTHSYNSNYGTLSVNYDSANYDYANMPDALTTTSTSAQVNAVATLMRDCGVAVNMGYSAGESGAFDQEARAALINFFRFSPNLSFAEKAYFTNTEWSNLLRENIGANQPVYYAGQGDAGGHAFVCDGYKTDDYFHFNFGWGGYANGWYLTSAVNPAGMEFNSDQSIIVGIVPDSTGNVILGQMAGTSTFTVDEPLEFYHLLGHNAYDGTSYSNSCNNNVLFISADPTKQLVLDIISFEDQNITVYDGNGGSQLTALYAGADNDLSPVVSTNHALNVAYQGNFYYAGFHLSVSQDNGCRMVSNIVASVDTTTVHLTWTENGNATQWQIEYGEKGFALGNGITVVTNDTTSSIEGLTKFVTYDLYIRPICGGSWFGPITVMPMAPYWIDIVQSQPEGYSIDEAGHVIISSVEGLAWWAKIADNEHRYWRWLVYQEPFVPTIEGLDESMMQNGWCWNRPTTITTDIDLDGYRWKPISYSADIDGQMHTISNMLIYEDASMEPEPYYGFFSSFSGPSQIGFVIKDLVFQNPVINCPTGYYGVLAGGLSEARIRNVSVNNAVINQYSSSPFISIYNVYGVAGGGLLGRAELTSIDNCYSTGSIVSKYPYLNINNGGIVGYAENLSSINNCYSSVQIQSQTGGVGSICAFANGLEMKNCYGIDYYPILDHNDLSNGGIVDTLRFDKNTQQLYGSVYFDDIICNTLLEALNQRVSYENNESWMTWMEDDNGNNDSFPVFSEPYVVTCPNAENIVAQNVIINSNNAILLTWDDSDDVLQWQIKCVEKDAPDNTAQYYVTDSNSIVIADLEIAKMYRIFVKPICDDTNQGGWGTGIQHVYDKPYWTDFVTTQPDGYIIDNDGNVIITSKEGFVWLSCLVNGLHGQEAQQFRNKSVKLMVDVDLSDFRWMPIGNTWWNTFDGSFDGNNHIISNLYVNEYHDWVGLFGHVYQGKFVNITIDNSIVKGFSNVGTICGMYQNVGYDWNYGDVLFDNCHVKNASVYGDNLVGGIGGRIENWGDETGLTIVVRNCFSSGEVHGSNHVGGLIGNIKDLANISNCYSACDIFATDMDAGGLIGFTKSCVLENSYATGVITSTGGSYAKLVGYLCDNITCHYMYGLEDENPINLFGYVGANCTIDNSEWFTSAGALDNAVTIGVTSYSDLLPALNAWVDANDTADAYRHWAADSTGENGGYPVFAYVPCTPATGSDSIVVCNSYTWRGTTYTSSTELMDTLSTMDGCDSIVTHYLTVKHSNSDTETTTACESYFFGGQWLYASGQYSDTLTNIAGCDSIVTLYLTINNPIHTATTVTACDSYTWQEAVITTSGTYHYTHTDANGCTQDDTLYLTINHNDTVIVDEEVCDSLTWYGVTYTASAYGVQYLTVPNAVGCDSIFFLDLTVNYTTYGEMSAVSCDSYQWDWNGAVYTASGDYTYRDTVNMNSQFCDSVLTLHLTVNYSATSDTTATACDMFVWYGHMGYDVSGDYEHRWWNVTADGCDSILTLHLTINRSAETTVTDTAEGSYTWHDSTYTESGAYTWIGETTEGCDSTVTLVLTVTQVGIEDVEVGSSFNIFVSDGRIVVEGATGEEVSIFDMIGRQILREDINSSLFTLHSSLSAGVYLVKVGSLPARKVVVIR